MVHRETKYQSILRKSGKTDSNYPSICRSLFTLLVASLLISCAPTQPGAKTLARTELMQLVFPSWQSKGKAQVQTLLIADDATDAPAADESEQRFIIKPQQVVQLDANHAVMITAAQMVDQKDEAIDGHASPGLLSAFWFGKDDDGLWRLSSQQNEVDRSGKYGVPDDTKIIKISKTQFALVSEGSDCFQGYCFTNLSLYEIGSNKIRPLIAKPNTFLRISSDNLGARDCDAPMKQSLGKTVTRQLTQDEFSSQECYDISGKWRIDAKGTQPGDLIVEFNGEQEKQTELNRTEPQNDADAELINIESTLNVIKQKQLFRYQNGQYHLVSGSNPNPAQ